MGSSTENGHAKLLISPHTDRPFGSGRLEGVALSVTERGTGLAVFVIELVRCEEPRIARNAALEPDRVGSIESEHQRLALAPLPTFSVESASISTADRPTRSTALEPGRTP